LVKRAVALLVQKRGGMEGILKDFPKSERHREMLKRVERAEQ
jgi:hypothetical protein